MTGFETVIVAEQEDVEAASPPIGQPSPPPTSSAPRKRNKSAFSCVLPVFGGILVLCFFGLVAGFITQKIKVSDTQQTQALAALPSSSKQWTIEQCIDEPMEHLKNLLESDSQGDKLEATLVAYLHELFPNCYEHYAVALAEIFTKVADLSTSSEEEDAMDIMLSERSVQCAEDIFADLTSPDEDKVNPISIGDILAEPGAETNQTMSPSATPTPPPPAENLTLAPVLLQTHQISTLKNASSSTTNDAAVNWTSFAEEFGDMAEKEKPSKATTTGLSKLSAGSGTTPTQQPSSTGINHPTMAPTRVESISMLPSKGSFPKKKQKDTPPMKKSSP